MANRPTSLTDIAPATTTQTVAAASDKTKTTATTKTIQIEDLINFECIKGHKLKFFYVKWSHTSNRLKLKKLTTVPSKLMNPIQLNSGPNCILELTSQSNVANVVKVLDMHLDKIRQSRPKRLLLFANPHGGKGRALSIFKRYVRPLLELAKIEYRLIVTQYANHARKMIEDPAFIVSQYDGLVGVGGDGMFSELMNGLLFRYHCEQRGQDHCEHDLRDIQQEQLESDRNEKKSQPFDAGCKKQLASAARAPAPTTIDSFKTPPIPIGIISAGSTDANSFGLIGTNDVITATLNIILANQIKIDVCSLHSYESDRLLRFASTFAGYGYFGDIIRESEDLRWLGPSRYDLTGFNNLIKHRTYNGHLRLLVSDTDGSPQDQDRCIKDCKSCHSNQATKFKLIELEGPFVGVNAAVTACRCPQTRKGFSPSQHLGNGCADLIVVRKCSRIQYLRYLLRTGYLKKSPFDLSYVEAFRCREFEFVVADNIDSSSWNVDGEILDNENSIRVRVNNKLLNVFGTGEPTNN